MKLVPSVRRLLPWAGAILLSRGGGLRRLDGDTPFLEYDYRDDLAAEATRSGLE